MGSYFEIWSRPGATNFGRVIDDPPFREATIHDAVNLKGDGTMQIPNSFDRFDDILKIDGSSSVASLVRVRSDIDDSVTFEWMPRALVPTSSKNDPYEDLSGRGIKQILEFAKTEAFDWDGTDDWVCSECDWVWGGPNILTTYSLGNIQAQPIRYELWTDASGGTFTLSDGTDTTDPIAFDASPPTIDTRLETDIAAITETSVAGSISNSGSGDEANPWIIEFVDPAFGITLTVNDAGLSGGSATLTLIQEGIPDPAPWQPNQHVSPLFPGTGTALFGNPTTWEVSTEQVHPDSTYSIKVDQPLPYDPGCRCNGFAGVQQVVSVTPGATYQAVGYVYPTDANDTFFLAIRSASDNEFIDSSTGTITAETLTPNTWNELTITDIEIPDNTSQIIFRFAQAGTDDGSNPSVFYVDLEQASFIEGQAATTIGEIVRELYDHATDTNLRNPIIWEDESNPGNPYLTLDFTDALDSAGNAWDDDEVKLYVYMRMSLYQVLVQLADSHGIEFRVVPDGVEGGTWLLQVYDKGSMSTTQDVAIQGGANDVRRMLRRFLPDTDYLVEGRRRVTARASNSGLRSALGRMEAARLDRELPSETAVQGAAAEDAADAEIGVEPWSYELVDPQDQPGTAYVLGDEIAVHDPPEADGQARFWEYVATFTPEAETWEVDLLAEPESSP